jgi:hypothetical protein
VSSDLSHELANDIKITPTIPQLKKKKQKTKNPTISENQNEMQEGTNAGKVETKQTKEKCWNVSSRTDERRERERERDPQ